jgi:hypothetical protein
MESYDIRGVALLIGFIVQGITLGLGQWLVLRSEKFGAGWKENTGWWILSTVLGFIVGFFVITLLNTIGLNLISWIAFGLVVGLAQWFVLRREVGRATWWILATVLAWIAIMNISMAPLQEGLIIGVVTGIGFTVLSGVQR